MTKVAAEDPSFAVKVRCQRLIFYKKLTVWERLNFLLFYFIFFSYWGFELFILTAQFWFRRKQLVYQPNWKELPYFLWVSNCLCSALHLALKPHVDLDVYTYTIAVVDLMNRDEQCNKNPLGEFSCRCITILLLWQVSMSFNPNVLRIFHSHVNYDSLTWPFLYILYLVIVWYLKPLAVNLLLKLSGRVMRRAISRLRWLF